MILTVDVGTSVTKVALWDQTGMVALDGAPLATRHPAPGRSEQDPSPVSYTHLTLPTILRV